MAGHPDGGRSGGRVLPWPGAAGQVRVQRPEQVGGGAPPPRWVVPLEAREACEEDSLCGGFTFQGVQLGVEQQVPTTCQPSAVKLPSSPCRCGSSTTSPPWSCRRPGGPTGPGPPTLWRGVRVTPLLPPREYILLPGEPEELHGLLLANSSLVVEQDPVEGVRLCRATPHCAGLSHDPSTGLLYSLEWIHFPLLRPHPTASTLLLLSARSNQLADDDQLTGLDRCCPETHRLPVVPEDGRSEIARQPCTISPHTFLTQYILRRVPVLLEVQPHTSQSFTTRVASPAPCSRNQGLVESPLTPSSTDSSTGPETSRQLRCCLLQHQDPLPGLPPSPQEADPDTTKRSEHLHRLCYC